MLALSSQRRLLSAIERARDVTVVAYLLPRGELFDALAVTARRGAHVTVRLEGHPYHDARGGIARFNQSTVEALRRDGADARLVDTDGTEAQLHAKAAAVDEALYLDDVNFAKGGTLLRDDCIRDVRALRAAAAGAAAVPSRRLALYKSDALALEASLLRAARRRGDVVVESESLGSGNAVYAQLERLGRSGRAPRLLLSRHTLDTKERSLVRCLERSGVRVRTCAANEKFAVTGSGAWIGSANATSAYLQPKALDWGARSRDARICARLRAAFETRWRSAADVP